MSLSKQKSLFPVLWDEALVFPQCEEGAAAEADTWRLFEALHTLLAGYVLLGLSIGVGHSPLIGAQSRPLSSTA